jgi:hypothetical protein
MEGEVTGLRQIKLHAPPFAGSPVNFFKAEPCGHVPGGVFLAFTKLDIFNTLLND